jgi:DUF1365 family protein
MTPLSPAFLMRGKLMHHRQEKYENHFTYPVYSFLVNVKEMDNVAKTSPVFSYNRPNLVSIHDKDHFDNPNRSIYDNVMAYLERQGVPLPDGDIFMLSNARVFGYVFDPISMFYCYNQAGEWLYTIAEVHNTHNERYPYLLNEQCALPPRKADGRNGIRRYWADKQFYVSPLIGMEARYEFALSDPFAPNFSLNIDEFKPDSDEKFFQAKLYGKTTGLTKRSLALALLRYPLMSVQIMFFIHWQAVKTHFAGNIPILDKPSTPPIY